MSDFPSGTVTFLLTDIESSTRLWEEHPKEMRAALARHDEIIRQAVENHAGYVFATAGDGFAVAFQRAHDGLLGAIEAQRDLRVEDWGGVSVLVRMALDTGESEERDGDYFGPSLNKASRLMSAGHGGQVLLSQATVEIARSDPPDEVSFEDLGEHHLKDLERPERVFQLRHPALSSEFGPLRVLDYRPNNLPVQLTSFVGREDELVELDQLFLSARLVTLIGPGGSGKTRLALEGAGRQLDQYRDGVWFVDLAPVALSDQVPQALARPLGVSGEPGRPTDVVLVNYLVDRDLLLVLDNCEHLVDTVSELVGGLLEAAPALNVLTTSREPLGVPGERIFEVPPLPLPDADDDRDVVLFDAVRLFVERAHSADSHFELTDANAEAIAQVCRRLDGIPLALELAAAQIRTFGPEQLIGLLDDRFGLLTSSLRTVPERHQTLRAAVEWSYDLLSESARRLFSRLSVFRGGSDLEAALEVCGTAPLSHSDVLELLPELVDKSLLVADRDGRETRYRLLETLREYGQESLESAELHRLRERHAAYFCGLTERAALGLRGHEQRGWIRRLAIDYDNVRQALLWAFFEEPEMGIRSASALADYWDAAGPRVEAHEWLKRAVELSESAEPDLRITVRLAAADLFLSTNLSSSIEFAEESLDEARIIGDEIAEGRALRVLALARGLQNDHEQAMSLGEQAIRIFRKLDDSWEMAWCLVRVAQADTQNPARSIRRFEESIVLLREVGDRRREGIALYSMADRSAQTGGDLDVAAGWVEESLQINEGIGSAHDRAHTLLELGKIMRRRGQTEDAADVLETALKLLRKLGDQRCTVRTLTALGLTLTETDDHKRAHQALSEGLEIARIVGEMPIVQVGLAGMARLLAGSRNSEAATLYGAADILSRNLGRPMSGQSLARRTKRLERLRAEMDPTEFENAWMTGESMSPNTAIDLALATQAPESR